VAARETDIRCTFAVVAGSGMGALADGLDTVWTVPFSDIDGVGGCTVAGHSGEVRLCDIGGTRVLLALGRRHVYEGTPDAMRHLLRWMHGHGIGDVLITSAAGSLRRDIAPGRIVVVDDAIDLQNRCQFVARRDTHGRDYGALQRHRRSLCVDAALTRQIEDAASRAGVAWLRGALACFSGPTYETPAEVTMAQRTGADVVTMSAAPEITAANECGMRVAALAAITNYATGLGDIAPDHADVLTSAQTMSRRMARIVRELAKNK
jgi:inosine/guanosine/xanthosine phosphorylase family protein